MIINRAGVWRKIEPVVPVKKEEYWDSGIEESYGGCAKLGEPVVIVSWEAQKKVQALCEAMGGKEWLAYLIGAQEGAGFYIADLLVPEQEVTASSVHVLDHPPLENVVGVLHSHHNMGSFFSKTDDDFVNANHPLSVVVSKDGWKGTARIEAPCGELIRFPDVYFEFEEPEVEGLDEWTEDALEKIKNRYAPPFLPLT